MTREAEQKPDSVTLSRKSAVPLKDRLSLSPEEASALTGIGLTSIRQAARGPLNARKHGSRTIILQDDLMAWLKALPMIEKNT
jgi:Helix-turn-helix domain